jgi:hypothetical protein
MPPDPKLLSGTTPAQRIAMWFDLMRTADKLLLAGMRHRLGPDGDIQEEYRRWYAEQMCEHDKVVERIMSRSRSSQESAHGG